MFSFRTTPLEKQADNALVKGGRLGLLCNQSAWHPEYGEYLFEFLSKRYNLVRLFTPDDGFFPVPQSALPHDDSTGAGSPLGAAEAASQRRAEASAEMMQNGAAEVASQRRVEASAEMPRSGADGGADDAGEAELLCGAIRLASGREELRGQCERYLADLDALLIELQDTGCRYSAFIDLILNIFRYLKEQEADLPVYILDRINPAGRQVEGTLMRAGYRSRLGVEGLPHRHGLTIGELAFYLYEEMHAKFPLHIISCRAQDVNRDLLPWSIPPTQFFCGLFSPHFCSGQSLWSATNVSAGFGTTRPLEQFGAPFMREIRDYNNKHGLENWNVPENPLADLSIYLRWTSFRPMWGSCAGEECYGFQLLPNTNIQYHSLNHTLRIMRFVRENCPDFDTSALPSLLGDRELIDFVEGEVGMEELKEHIKVEEQKWIKKAKKAILYPEEQLFRIK